jgi:hypothetical protein
MTGEEAADRIIERAEARIKELEDQLVATQLHRQYATTRMEELGDRIKELEAEVVEADATAEMHAAINRRVAAALGRPESGPGSSWDSMPREVEGLKAKIEAMERDPAHANCRNAEAQLERQRDAEAEAARTAEARLAAVVELHPSGRVPGGAVGQWCHTCECSSPCQTLRAAEGKPVPCPTPGQAHAARLVRAAFVAVPPGEDAKDPDCRPTETYCAYCGKHEGDLDDSARAKALDIARRYGGIDGSHHRAWVIDQMCRSLLGDAYEAFVRDACAGTQDEPGCWEWNVGVAP